MKSGNYLMSALTLMTAWSANAAMADKPAEPFANPYLAASTKPIAHGVSDFTPLAGPRGPSRRLRKDEIVWKPLGPVNGWLPIYSGPYPNGKRVIWAGGLDRIAKLDADTMETLNTYSLDGTYFSEDQVRRTMDKMNSLSDAEYASTNAKLWPKYYRQAIGSVYRLLSRDNELYVPNRGTDGVYSIRVYGDDNTDPASPIVLRREWKIPADASTEMLTGMTMTSDGWLVIATVDGAVVALSRDLKQYNVLKLPRINPKIETKDFFLAFVRNSFNADDHGGIFIASRDYLHRVQWTGSKLSLDEADGGWSARYPNGAEQRGTGSTPGLIGWGPKEDHLVIISDGSDNNNAIVFWRDQIPDDWKGLPGYDRRVAGIVPLRFGVSPDEKVINENAAIIYGYGAFFDNHYPQHPVSEKLTPEERQKKTPTELSLTDSFSMHVPGNGALGGAMIRWDPKTRTLKQTWNSQMNFMSSVCTVSGATELLYCWGNRNREYTLEGVDWHTGKTTFTYTLGKDKSYQPLGGWVDIAPNGTVDCGCAGGQGLVRVQPKEGKAKHK